MPRIYATGLDLVCRLVEALDIDKAITSITIEADCREAAWVTIRFPLVDPEQHRKVKEVVERYRLTPADTDGD